MPEPGPLRALLLGVLLATSAAPRSLALAAPPRTPEGLAANAEGWSALTARRSADARQHFERALAIDPESTDALLGLGDALFWLEDYATARATFERVIAREPSAHAYNGLGQTCFVQAGRSYAPRERPAILACARKAFARALALDPQHAGARDALRVFSQVDRGVSGLRPLELVVGVLLLFLGVACAGAWSRRPQASWRRPLVAFLVTRAIVVLAFAVAPSWLREAPEHPIPIVQPSTPVLDAIVTRWDSNLYVDVARYGYAFEGSTLRWGSVGELPFLPIAFRWSSWLLNEERIAACLLPNAGLLLASLLLFALVREREGERVATATCWTFLLLPGSLYGSVLYAESFALCFILLAASAARRGLPAVALLAGTLAGLSRVNTLAAAPLLASEAFAAFAHLPRTRRQLAAAAIALSPCIGLAIFGLYSHFAFGDALAYLHELRAHRFPHAGMLVALSELSALLQFGSAAAADAPSLVFVLAVAAILLYAAAALGLFTRGEHAAAGFVALALAMALGSSLAAAPRYLWIAFPAAVWLARLADRPVLRPVLSALAALLLALVASAFGRFYYVT